MRAFAQAAEELGYDHLLAYDHVLGADTTNRPDWPGPYRAEHQFHEIFVLFGYLAAVAPGLELVTGVLVLPQRQTALVAKQAAEIDLLTGGRFRLGVGLGWNFVEFEALGEDFTNRGRRSEEQIEVLRRLWTEPVVDFEGRWHRIPAAGINPLPGAAPDPGVDRRLGRGGDPADRTACGRLLPPAAARGRLAGDDGALPRLGRGGRAAIPPTIGVEQRINVAEGTPDDWRREAEEWRALGATHVSVAAMRGGLDVDGHIARIGEAFAALA